MNKKVFFIISIFLICVIGFFYIFNQKSKFSLIYADDEIIKSNLSDVVKLLNKDKSAKKVIKGNVDFYAYNFVNNNKVDIINHNNINILWLGGIYSFGVDVDYLANFDLVLVNSFKLYGYLVGKVANLHYFPLTIANKKDYKKQNCSLNNKKCYWVVIGQMPEFISYLNKNNIPFKQFLVADTRVTKKVSNDFENVIGMATSYFYYNKNSYDISLLYFLSMLKGIPVIAKQSLGEYNELAIVFNNFVYVYNNSEDIASLFLNKFDTHSQHKVINYFFNHTKTKERLIQILSGEKPYVKKLEGLTEVSVNSIPIDNRHGDYLLADELAKSLRGDFEYSYVSFPFSYMQDLGEVNIYIKSVNFSYSQRDIVKDRISVLYIIYPILGDDIELDEYINLIEDEIILFDAVVVCSLKLHNRLKQRSFNSYYVPQFTNTDKFYPNYSGELESEVLFVGGNHFKRASVEFLLENGIKVDIHGPSWGDIAISDGINNNLLGKYYASAKIVLNDTLPGMKKFGFISNRIFDASASGALVISDYMKEIEDVYGDSVVMWKTKEELIEKVKYYLDPKNENERKEKANRAREITLKNFTNQIIAQKFRKIIDELKSKN